MPCLPSLPPPIKREDTRHREASLPACPCYFCAVFLIDFPINSRDNAGMLDLLSDFLAWSFLSPSSASWWGVVATWVAAIATCTIAIVSFRGLLVFRRDKIIRNWNLWVRRAFPQIDPTGCHRIHPRTDDSEPIYSIDVTYKGVDYTVLFRADEENIVCPTSLSYSQPRGKPIKRPPTQWQFQQVCQNSFDAFMANANHSDE